MFYEEGDQDEVDINRKKGSSQLDDIDDAEEDVPIDILENTRGRSIRDHVSDEAVSREIQRRYFQLRFYIFFVDFENFYEVLKIRKQNKLNILVLSNRWLLTIGNL